jgi:hypothetical protein
MSYFTAQSTLLFSLLNGSLLSLKLLLINEGNEYINTWYFPQAAQKCPRGTYRNVEGGTKLASCLKCPAGNYCPEPGHDGTTFLPCTAG